MARANTDIQQVETVVILIPLTAASCLTMVGVLTIMVIKSPVLALLGLGALPFLNIAATRFSNRIAPVNLALQQELADLSGVVEESLAGVRVVKGFGAERMQVKRLEAEAESVLDQALAAAKLRAGFIPLIDFLPTVSMVAILWYGGHQVLDGQLQVGDILAFNLYILMLIWPLRMIGMLIAQASRASAGAGRVHEILVTDPEIVDHADAVDLPAGAGHRDVRGGAVRVRPGSLGAERASTSPSAAVKRSRSSAPPAAGRPPSPGCCRGSTTSKRAGCCSTGWTCARSVCASSGSRSGSCSRTPSSSRTPCGRTSRSPIRKRRRSRCAGRRGSPAPKRSSTRLPDGYDTVIGEHGFSLSGGQRQRIAIARAVIADPRVLILDDATSSVDPTKEHEIRAALGEVMSGRTTIIIAHRPATIALADRVVLLADGLVVAEGTHDELLATSERYRTVLAAADASGTGCGGRGAVMRGGWVDGGPVDEDSKLDREQAHQVMRRLWRMLRPYRGQIALGVVRADRSRPRACSPGPHWCATAWTPGSPAAMPMRSTWPRSATSSSR